MDELVIPAFPTTDNLARDIYIFSLAGQVTLVDHDSRVTGVGSVVSYLNKQWIWTNLEVPRVIVATHSITKILYSYAKEKKKAAVATKLSIMTALSASGYYVELDVALGRKFPSSTSETTEDFRRELGLSSSAVGKENILIDVMEQLCDRAARGEMNLSQEEMVERFLIDEKSILTSNDPWRQFAAATSLTDTWTSFVMSDPVGRDLYRFDGSILDATVTKVSSMGIVSLSCERTPKNRSGKILVSLPSDSGYPHYSSCEFSLLGSRVSTHGKVTMDVRVIRGARPQVGETLTFMEKPFLMKTIVGKSKWSDLTPSGPISRPLPPELVGDL